MTILVTGGAGFIGANFVYYLLREHPEDRVVCVDCLTYAGNLTTLAPALDDPRFRFYKTDICDRAGISAIFVREKPDIVVNFAAESHVDRSIADPSIFLQTNIIGTSVLMDACREYGNVRFHQVSTDEVYGDLPLDRPDLLFTEQTPLPVYGRGLNVRDWLYVGDHCRAIDLVIRRGRIGEVYNIGGHNEMRNIDIVRLICRKLGKPESLITYVPDRKGHDLRYAIDPTKIHAELGWLPETKFADGIGQTIDWYLAHRDWWEEILSGEYRTYYARMYGARQTPEQP